MKKVFSRATERVKKYSKIVFVPSRSPRVSLQRSYTAHIYCTSVVNKNASSFDSVYMSQKNDNYWKRTIMAT